MHFEILVEGQAELTALSILMPKIIGEYGNPHTWKIHKHRGIGRLPDNPMNAPNVHDSTLLHQLPAKLRGYSKAQKENQMVIVLLDLDNNDLQTFKTELDVLLQWCEPNFSPDFIFAIEELEAWYLGDREALVKFNEKIDITVLDSYTQDSIVGTWELLAKADEPSILAHRKRSAAILDKKKEWSKKIPPLMIVSENISNSFNTFVSRLQYHIS
ncbi:DUF4276 family protein [Alteromonas sp. NFXS44]|uniref:DUF4276 family protein n=1 Tax=Alteromonas sp. NFXS44 TaxID=2818435 RepID=UPI0032DF96A3